METFNVGSIASAQPIFLSAELLDSVKKLPPLSSDMKALSEKLFATATSLIVSLAEERYGWSFAMEKSSMKNPLEYMVTPAGLAEQFQRVAVMIEHSSDNRDTADRAFHAFCQRMCNGPMLEVLSKVVEFPADSELTMIRFLEHLCSLPLKPTHTIGRDTPSVLKVIVNLKRQLKAMEIDSPFLAMCNRMFIWTARGVRMAAKDQIMNKSQVSGEVEQWTGKVARKEKTEPKSVLDDGILSIFRYKMKDTELETFEWSVKLSEDGLVIRRGHADTLEAAADAIYRAFYSSLTKKKLVDACAVSPGTKLVVFGNWLTNEEYMAYPNKVNLQIISDASDDTRDDHVFVVNYPTLGKQKAVVTAYQVTKARNYGEQNSDNVVVTLRSGFVLDATQNWYVLNAEKNVMGEIMCPKCENVGTVSGFGCLHVRGRGLLCGPCIDHLVDNYQLDDDVYDSQTMV